MQRTLTPRAWMPLLIAAVALSACTGATHRAPASPPASALPPVSHPADNPSTPLKLALGQQLFADPRLSGSGKMACQSCHYRDLGWTDAKPLSMKDDGKLNTRHTPSLYNVGYQSHWYWDGRATTLEGQVLAAWRAQIGADPAKVAALLDTVPGYRSQFQAVWGSGPTPDNVVKTLAAFFRSLVSTNAPWDRYEAGDTRAVSPAAVEGHRLFTGKAGCVACHAPPTFSTPAFFNIGLESGKANPDPGRFNVTKNEADRGAFKVPGLRSVALSAPYFHDGSVATLKEAVRYMASAGKADPAKTPLMTDKGLSDTEVDQIVAFLQSLTSTETWTQPTLP
ncbi:c-type cytochrome [Ideonella sp. 4Y11]|uniref:C-type cytochrome n=1 Tax=Ideonella aquatica TaxID=2824119 RepID=A0A941BIV0_9BURK|nr:cytochrome c peroxidase [Ideonella aquatica]MBQ0958198.1 c-type cytochrome [Ideonella aquatica]